MPDLNSAEESSRRRKLEKILSQFDARQRAGQGIDQAAMLQAFPELASELKAYFETSGKRINNAFATTQLEQDLLRPDHHETVSPVVQEVDTASEFTVRMFGRYQLLRPLGEGAMGSVYLALDTTLDRLVALKMPKPSKGDAEEFLPRFAREARAAAGLRHSSVCRVYDTGEVDGTAFITMDFIDGVPLSRLIGTPKLASVDTVLKMIRVIADAIQHAHENGVIHRDLKAGNILVDDQMNAFVTDFGLARRLVPTDNSLLTQEGVLIGTPAYMAPEQVRGEQEKVGVCSDIYSLGVLLFEMLLGRLPFDGSLPELLAKVMRDQPPVPGRLRPELSENVDDVVLKMLRKDPAQRYQSMKEVISALDLLAEKWKRPATTTESTAATSSAGELTPFEILKAHIEQMLKKGQYASAIQDLEKLASEKSPRARNEAAWAQKKLPEVRAEAKALSPAGLAAIRKTCQQLFEMHDYPGCIQLLEEIPPLRRNEAMEELLSKAKRCEIEAEQLLEQIRDKERRQDIDGLESLVKKFLRLKPGNAYVKKLCLALQTYSGTPASRRNYRFEKGRLQPVPEPSLLQKWGLLGLLTGVLVFLSVSCYVRVYLKTGQTEMALLNLSGSESKSSKSVEEPKNLESSSEELSFGDHPDSATGGLTGAFSRSTAPDDGWTYLFDGDSAAGWSTLGPFQVRDGQLVAANTRAMAVSEHQYDDFELEAEWKIQSGSNGGILYRDPAIVEGLGNEYQIIDPAHPVAQRPQNRSGGFYGVVAPGDDALRPLGEWNASKIVCQGTVTEHWLNGQRVVRYDSSSAEWKSLVDAAPLKSDKSKLGLATQGHILLMSQTGELAFRLIRIRSKAGGQPIPVASVSHLQLNLPREARRSSADAFHEIHNATLAELLAWSQALPKQFCPLWTSVRANSPEPRFDAVAVVIPVISDWKLMAVDAEGESFEQPGLKGMHPMSIVSFRDGQRNRSLCLVSDSKNSWQFWIGGEPLIQKKIAENLKIMSNMRGRDWPSVPAFVASQHATNPGSYYLLAMPRPLITEGQLLTTLNSERLSSSLQAARVDGRVPGYVSFDRFERNEPTFLVVLRNRIDGVPPGGLGGNSDDTWACSTAMSIEDYERLIPLVSSAGGKPRSVFSYIWNNELFYAAVWGGISQEEFQSLASNHAASEIGLAAASRHTSRY